MSLTILIPTYKRAATLKNCLASIRTSQLNPSELIIGDDGGDLETLKVITEYSQIFPIIHLKPEGKGSLSSNISRLFKAATCEWIYFIHDDDFTIGDHSNIIATYGQNADFIFSDHFLADEQGNLLQIETEKNSHIYKRDLLKEGIQPDPFYLSINQAICLDGFYIRRACVNNILPNPNYGQVADYFWVHNLVTQPLRICFISERTFAYVLSTIGLTATGGYLNEDSVIGFKDLYNSLSENNKYKKTIKQMLSMHTWHAVNAALKRNDRTKANMLLKSVNYNYSHSLKHKMLMPIQVLLMLLRSHKRQ